MRRYYCLFDFFYSFAPIPHHLSLASFDALGIGGDAKLQAGWKKKQITDAALHSTLTSHPL